MCAALLRPLLLILVLVLGGRFCLGDRPLLVFLIDGFRFDYMDELSGLPGFRELVETGVKVDYVTPEFPSLSYPNYYSLMTGRELSVCLSFCLSVRVYVCLSGDLKLAGRYRKLYNRVCIRLHHSMRQQLLAAIV